MAHIKRLNLTQNIYQSPMNTVSLLHPNVNYSLNALFNAVSGKGFTNFFLNLFNDPMNAIFSLRLFPVQSDFVPTHSNWGALVMGDKAYLDIQSKPVDSVKGLRRFRVGRIDGYNPRIFTDLEPYAHLQLYLPYLNFIDLPITQIAGKRVDIFYVIDWTTGTATASIEYYNEDIGEYVMIATKSGKIAVDIPIGKDSTGEQARNIIETSISTILTVSSIAVNGGTGANVGAIKGVATTGAIVKGASSIVNNLQTTFQRGGSIENLVSMMMPSSCYMIITKPKLVNVDEDIYAHTYGKPLYQTRVLSTMRGFTVVDDVHLENFPTATSGELDEVERLLKSGVHL